jgi:hypothetical protein
MKNAFLFLCFILSQLTFSQSRLVGFVTEQNSGKKTVEDALIKSGGAKQIKSSTNGQYVSLYLHTKTYLLAKTYTCYLRA